MGWIKNPLCLYRLAHRLHGAGIPVFPWLITYWIRFFYAAFIPPSAVLGAGTKLGYGGLGVVIHKDAVIGRNCLISHHVTIGGNHATDGVPVIGDHVYIGAGAKILGPVTIGNRATIGANAVVLHSIPEGATAVGVPARVIRTKSGNT